MNWLDRPVWASLIHTPHFAMGGDLAKRFQRDVNVFAATCNEDAASLVALQELVREGESVYLAQVPAICVPDGLQIERAAQAVQMLAKRPIIPSVHGYAVVELGNADAAEMCALARLTEPGPFLERTHTMGRFVGVRIDGRLAAMAGERMRFQASRKSAVCAHIRTFVGWVWRKVCHRLSPMEFSSVVSNPSYTHGKAIAVQSLYTRVWVLSSVYKCRSLY